MSVGNQSSDHARIKTLPPNWLAQLVVVSLESVPSPTADLLPAPSLLHHYIDLYHKPAVGDVLFMKDVCVWGVL
eukprot:1378051-Amorphochlora_amoeboformis.AAC.2